LNFLESGVVVRLSYCLKEMLLLVWLIIVLLFF